MKKNDEVQNEDDLRDEYDFTQLQVVACGPRRRQPKNVTVELAPDVAAMFPNAIAVNEALRFLIRATQHSGPNSQSRDKKQSG